MSEPQVQHHVMKTYTGAISMRSEFKREEMARRSCLGADDGVRSATFVELHGFSLMTLDCSEVNEEMQGEPTATSRLSRGYDHGRSTTKE